MILPENIDKEKIEAKVEHGALTVNLPKKKMNEIKKSEKNIEIKYITSGLQLKQETPWKGRSSVFLLFPQTFSQLNI